MDYFKVAEIEARTFRLELLEAAAENLGIPALRRESIPPGAGRVWFVYEYTNQTRNECDLRRKILATLAAVRFFGNSSAETCICPNCCRRSTEKVTSSSKVTEIVNGLPV